MTTLPAQPQELKIAAHTQRRPHPRADLEEQGIQVERWDGTRRLGKPFGTIVDLSAGGVRIRTTSKGVRPDNQIRLRLELPEYAGITPFIDSSGNAIAAKKEWVGWMAVSRV